MTRNQFIKTILGGIVLLVTCKYKNDDGKVRCDDCSYGKYGYVYLKKVPRCSLIADTVKKDYKGMYNAETSRHWDRWPFNGGTVGAWERKGLYYARQNEDGNCPFYTNK